MPSSCRPAPRRLPAAATTGHAAAQRKRRRVMDSQRRVAAGSPPARFSVGSRRATAPVSWPVRPRATTACVWQSMATTASLPEAAVYTRLHPPKNPAHTASPPRARARATWFTRAFSTPGISALRTDAPDFARRRMLAHSRKPGPHGNPRNRAQPNQIHHGNAASAVLTYAFSRNPGRRNDAPLFTQQQNRSAHQQHRCQQNHPHVSKWIFQGESSCQSAGQPFLAIPVLNRPFNSQSGAALPQSALLLPSTPQIPPAKSIASRPTALVRFVMHLTNNPSAPTAIADATAQHLVPLTVRAKDRPESASAALPSRRHNRQSPACTGESSANVRTPARKASRCNSPRQTHTPPSKIIESGGHSALQQHRLLRSPSAVSAAKNSAYSARPI